MELKDLQKKIPYKWKIQTVSKDKPKAQCVAYIDARDVMNLLDEVVGADNWQDKYEMIGNKFVAGIGIRVKRLQPNISTDPNYLSNEMGEWVWKWDTGTSGDFEVEKSEFSDAFKRAAVKWGIGRFLYDLDFKWVDTNMPGKGAYPVDEQGKRVWNLTEYLSKPHTSSHTATTASKQAPVATNAIDTEVTAKCRMHGDPLVQKISKNTGKPYWSHVMPDGSLCFGAK